MGKVMRRIVNGAVKGLRRGKLSRQERREAKDAQRASDLAVRAAMPHEWQCERTVEFWAGRM